MIKEESVARSAQVISMTRKAVQQVSYTDYQSQMSLCIKTSSLFEEYTYESSKVAISFMSVNNTCVYPNQLTRAQPHSFI